MNLTCSTDSEHRGGRQRDRRGKELHKTESVVGGWVAFTSVCVCVCVCVRAHTPVSVASQ